MRVAIYARVSTKKDAQKNSLENQVSYATSLAAQNGWTISNQYIDDGVSGATRDNREAIQRLLEDSKKKKFDIVIAKSVSRLGRNTLPAFGYKRDGKKLVLDEVYAPIVREIFDLYLYQIGVCTKSVITS
ncbi:hypothetical protein D3C74_128940 [compost metagenome]